MIFMPLGFAINIMSIANLSFLQEANATLIMLCGYAIGFLSWTIWGLFVRYDSAGSLCSQDFLSYAGTVINVFYIILASLLGFFVCFFCCIICLFATGIMKPERPIGAVNFR